AAADPLARAPRAAAAGGTPGAGPEAPLPAAALGRALRPLPAGDRAPRRLRPGQLVRSGAALAVLPPPLRAGVDLHHRPRDLGTDGRGDRGRALPEIGRCEAADLPDRGGRARGIRPDLPGRAFTRRGPGAQAIPSGSRPSSGAAGISRAAR